MGKDVLIYIKGIQDVDGEKDCVEMTTEGRYYKRKDTRYISYKEMEEGDTELTIRNTLKVEGTKCITLTKTGKYNNQLIIEKGERHQCHYDNGFAEWIMGIEGYEIENGLEDNGGVLNFKYSTDINAVLMGEHEVNIVVRECNKDA